MADSENSRTLPAITCRNPLQRAEWLLSNNFSDQEHRVPGLRDIVLTKWHAWHCAFQELTDLGRAQQKLESQLRSMLPPHQMVLSTDSGGPFATPSMHGSLDRSREDGNTCAHAAFLTERHNWAPIDESNGYRRAKHAEEHVSIIEEHLADELLRTPAMTTVAVAAKLHCLLARDSPSPDSDERPWPQIRSVLSDILAMNGVS
ncbi:hypothetical protein [Agrobacterium larrymoorei]|uniref:Uncharacterized protein n=1 Tax=Agrobacterium larrymoorei TaxID=160699 RepID=A0A4D7E3D0_9HYPH|nr:hypothetical protein [Agrobacterium larrymoorei]QCJ00667.1 hypothetical protein CFBP5473_21960 [Agrobacterium larrymoorei]QYA10664.1 hypothetical protein J5285_24195 [Agrobacterium larrymoorei]